MSDYLLDDAAAAALWRLQQASPYEERIGLLYDDAGALAYTDAAGQGDAGRSKGRFEIPSGSLRGIYHNHPPRSTKSGRMATRRDSHREEFSSDDVSTALRLGVPSYISAGNKIRAFDPETRRERDVLAAIPIDEIRSHLMRVLFDRDPTDPRGLKR